MKSKTQLPGFFFSLALVLFLSAQCFVSDAHTEPTNNDIQYLAVSTYYTTVYEILDAVGTRGRKNRRLAVSCTFSYIDHDEKYTISQGTLEPLKNMLQRAVDSDVPVIIHLDGVNWWGRRHDLWNWWDPSKQEYKWDLYDNGKPGYDPKNIDNVERFDWGASTTTAVKIGWRNWRTPVNPLRVAPHPNLASPALRAAQTKALDIVLPIIAEWYNKLPADRKYLFGGLVFGWELSTYHQAYYLANGNDYLNTNIYPPVNDPFPAWSRQGEPGTVLPLGYAAAQTLGLQKEGGEITTATEDAICVDYFKFLIKAAIRHGIDPKKIITHTIAGFKTATGGGFSGRASFIDADGDIPAGVIPGWTAGTADFRSIGVNISIAESKGLPWAAIEVPPVNIRYDLLIDMFNFKNNRFINIFNWEAIRNNSDAIAAIREALRDGGSVSVGAQNGGLTAGTAGSATFPVTTTEIIGGAAIALNNINSVAGITLGTTVTAGDKTTLAIGTTDTTPQGVHQLTLIIDGVTSNSFNLIVVNKVSLDDVKYYPNPLQPSKGLNYSRMQFSNLPPETRIKIYTILGQVVRELKADVSGTAVWDGQNNAGEKAASGVYIVYMEDGSGNKKRIKIAVER